MSVPNLITCEVDGIQYLLHPQVLGSTEAPIKADQVIPVLLLTEEELNGTPDQLGQLLQYYVETDDVCSPSFTDILVEKPSKDSSSNLSREKKNDSSYPPKAAYRLQKTILHISSIDNPEAQDDDNLPSGPYFLSGPNLHQAYRLYPDTQDAFIYGMIPNDVHNPSGFQAVSFLASDSMSKTIPVPSRHYTRLTTRGRKRPSPIRGKRITLTDGLSLLGTQTTLSCKAYVDTYPPASETDAYVQRLLEEGAVLVGKTKTSQLRIGNSLWPETHFPANPRAARKGNIFDCRGTGVGSASALAGYGWLEYAVGGNVDSAVRESGKRYGLYGLRRSLTVEHDKSSPIPNDSVGIFGRSLHDLSTIAECTFSPLSVPAKESSRNNVKKILYLDYAKDHKSEYAMDVFVNALERHLNVDRTTINLDEEWEKYRVKSGIDFSLGKTAQLLYDLNHYHEYAKFRKDYPAKFHSSRGLVDLEAQVLWSSACDHVKQHTELQDQVKIFRDWFEQRILAIETDTGTCGITGDTIIVIPDINFHQGHIIGFFGRMLGLEDMLSPQTATPQLSVPFTQNPGEWLGDEQTYTPVVASVIGPRMTDISLITLITQALTASGLPISVQPGRLCFPLPSSADATTAMAAADSDDNDKNNDDGHDEAGPTTAELQGRAATKLHLHEMWLYSKRVEEDDDDDDDEKMAPLTLEQGKKLKSDGNSWDGKTLAKSWLDIQVDLRGLKE